MREIKFRAWIEDENKMIYFDFENVHSTQAIIVDSDLNEHHYYIDGDTPIMQFTGLRDKKKRQIYDGDILIYESSKRVFEIYWDRKWSGWSARFVGEQKRSGIDSISRYELNRGEVISNIHEQKVRK